MVIAAYILLRVASQESQQPHKGVAPTKINNMIAHVKSKTMPPTFPHLRNVGFLTTPNEKRTTLNMIFSVIWYFMSLWAILHYGL